MRLTLVISSLGCGGAERVMTTMANHWAAKGWEITLLTLDDESTPRFYNLDGGVRHIALGVAGNSTNLATALRNSFKRVYKLRSAIRASRPDGVISFMDRTNVMTLLATRGLNVPVIVSERVDPNMHRIGGVWRWLRKISYPSASLLVVQSEAALNYFSPRMKSCTRIIPNPIDLPPGHLASDSVHRPTLISVGRLDRQKGFDLLLGAFAKLKDRHSDWTLTILGEGPQRQQLESLRDELGLADRVMLAGCVANVYEALQQATLFVMSSRYEGFPNALCEAMSCGLPVISTDCPSGPRDIIIDGIDGILVPNENVNALAEAMGRLMGSEVERERLAARAPEVAERFGLERIMGMWEQALDQITSARSNGPVKSSDLSGKPVVLGRSWK